MYPNQPIFFFKKINRLVDGEKLAFKTVLFLGILLLFAHALGAAPVLIPAVPVVITKLSRAWFEN